MEDEKKEGTEDLQEETHPADKTQKDGKKAYRNISTAQRSRKNVHSRREETLKYKTDMDR